jgi:hypothetical protein
MITISSKLSKLADECNASVLYDVKIGTILFSLHYDFIHKKEYVVMLKMILHIELDVYGNHVYTMLNIFPNNRVWKLNTQHKTNMLKTFMKVA